MNEEWDGDSSVVYIECGIPKKIKKCPLGQKILGYIRRKSIEY